MPAGELNPVGIPFFYSIFLGVRAAGKPANDFVQ
jgi:hypothetical protein